MFADSVIESKLDLLEAEFGWRPKPHSIEEVDAWKKQLATAFEEDSKGNIYMKRKLTKSEQRFIENERLMVSASCGYFLTRYYYIKAKNRILRFVFRSGQWIVWRILQELDAMGVSKELQVLKARKLGISTLAEGIMTWGALFIPGAASQIGSADAQKTQVMLGMMTLAIDQLPSWLPPTQTRSKTKSDRAMLEFEHIGSLIIVQPGSMMGGMGQGTTPTMIHLSEVSQFTNPVQQLDEGLLKAVESSPDVVFILESTGDAGHRSAWWWTEQWIANRDNYWQGGSRFLPVFLPWHTTPELYPGEHWLKKFPMPEGFTPNQDTIDHVTRAEAYVRNSEMLSRVIGKDWTMPLTQQWYWQYNYLDHKRRRVEKSWFRQMPCDDYEALLGERDKVYSQDAIDAVADTVGKASVYMLAGDGMEEKREPEEAQIWYGAEAPARQRFHWTTPKKDKMEWMLVPLAPVPELTFDPLEKLLIWKEPEEGYDYSVGDDTGTGVGGDRFILNVTRHGTNEFPDEQVAEFASDSIPTAEQYAWIAAVTAYYAKYMNPGPKGHPKICPEMRRKFGDLPYHQTQLLGFRRWHEWGQGFDRKTFEDKVGKHGRIGWFTNEWSRPMLLSAFQYAVENGWYVVRSKWLQDEMKELEQKFMASGKTRVDHASGKHDDRVFAAAMAYWTLHQRSEMMQRMKLRYEQPQKSGIIIERGPAVMTVEITGKTR